MIVTDTDDMEDIINTYNKQKEHKIYKGLLLSLSIIIIISIIIIMIISYHISSITTWLSK